MLTNEKAYSILVFVRKNREMHEWLSGGVSPCQGEGRGFESRLVLFRSFTDYCKAFYYLYRYMQISFVSHLLKFPHSKRETVTNSLPFKISNIICFQQFYIQWLIVVSSYFEQSQILQVLLPQAEEEYKQTSGSYLPSSLLSLLHPFSPVLPAAPLFPL